VCAEQKWPEKSRCKSPDDGSGLFWLFR
jgi:hypothetical protein